MNYETKPINAYGRGAIVLGGFVMLRAQPGSGPERFGAGTGKIYASTINKRIEPDV